MIRIEKHLDRMNEIHCATGIYPAYAQDFISVHRNPFLLRKYNILGPMKRSNERWQSVIGRDNEDKVFDRKSDAVAFARAMAKIHNYRVIDCSHLYK